MLDLTTKVWTDKEGKETPLSQLEDVHLLNIQRFLKRILRNGDQIRDKVELVAVDYDSSFCDKDWYVPGSALRDVDGIVEDIMGRNKTALMLVSQEVRKRGFKPKRDLK